MSKEIFWVRHRTKWCHTNGKWEYTFMYHSKSLSKEAQIEDFTTETNLENQWSEHYRGCEAELVENVPEEILEVFIGQAKGRIKSAQQVLETLEQFKALQK